MPALARRPGSIPAYAGEPPGQGIGIRNRKVYPRVCGGTESLVVPAAALEGLSPRMRGNHQGSGPINPAFRSIPAYAGEP